MATTASTPSHSLEGTPKHVLMSSARKKLKDFMKGPGPVKMNGLEEHQPLDSSLPRRTSNEDSESSESTETGPNGVVDDELILEGFVIGSPGPGTPAIALEDLDAALVGTLSRAASPTREPSETLNSIEETSNDIVEEPVDALPVAPPAEPEPTSEQRVAELTSQLKTALEQNSAQNPQTEITLEPSSPSHPPLAPESIPRRSFSFLANLIAVVPSDDETQPSHPLQRITRLESVVSSLSNELENARRDRTRVVDATNFTVVKLVEELKRKEDEVVAREAQRYAAKEKESRERIDELEGFLKDMAEVHTKVRKLLEGEIEQLKGRVAELHILASMNSKPPTAPEPLKVEPDPEPVATGPRTGAEVLVDTIQNRAVVQLRSANAKLRKDVEDAHGLMDKQQEKIETLIQEKEEVERELISERQSRRTSFDSDALGPLLAWGDKHRRQESVHNKVQLVRSLVASPVTTTFPSTYPTRPGSAMSQASGSLNDDDPLRALSNRYNLLQQQHHALAKRLEEQAGANRELKRLIVQASLGPNVAPQPSPRRSGSFFSGGRKSTDIMDAQQGDSLLLERFAEMQNELSKVKGENEALKVRVGELEWAVGEVVHEVDAQHRENETEAAARDVARVDGEAEEGKSPPGETTEDQPPLKAPIRRETIDAVKEKLGVAPIEPVPIRPTAVKEGEEEEHDQPHTEMGVTDSLLGRDLRTCCSQCGGSENPVVML